VLNAQGTAIAVVGLLVGVPLGVIAGRAAWSLVAHRVPLEDVSPFAAVAIVLLIPSVAVITNLLALLPGRRIARLHPAEQLRAE
jgi:ABC-type lipoprotein release transport system permease subunit